MKPVHQLKTGEFSKLVDTYFNVINRNNGKKRAAKKTPGSNAKSSKDVNPLLIFPTVTGLAHYLGFTSRDQFERYKAKSKFSTLIHRALLRVESVYEQRLHQHSTSGAIFVLKSMGWTDSKISQVIAQKPLDIRIIDSGPAPAATEKEVIIDDQPPSQMTNDQ